LDTIKPVSVFKYNSKKMQIEDLNFTIINTSIYSTLKFYVFYFLLKTKVLTFKKYSIYKALDFPMLLYNNNTFIFVSQVIVFLSFILIEKKIVMLVLLHY